MGYLCFGGSVLSVKYDVLDLDTDIFCCCLSGSPGADDLDSSGEGPDDEESDEERDEDLLDTSQYVSSEMSALEREQKQIDERAAEVEWSLRQIMDRGDG